MNRTQRAKVRAARRSLDIARAFKRDALFNRIGSSYFDSASEEFKKELEIFKGKLKQVRKLKKYNGAPGLLTEKEYMEFMGA